MKPWHIVLLLFTVFLSTSAAWAVQGSESVPKYNPATESTFKGIIVSVSERNCPVSGGLGFHFVLKLQDGNTIEVHVAASKFIKTYDVALNKGDQVEVVGSKVTFEGVETIFARSVTHGTETFVFRDQTGQPVW